MDPAAADAAASDVAAGADIRRGGKGNDTLYRRPPAHPPVESTTGGSWFAGGTDVPEPGTGELAETSYGAPAQSMPSRASFGFTEGPISPVRSVSPAPVGPSEPARQSGRQRPAPAAPAARQAAPTEQSWPPRSPLGAGRSTADRMPGDLVDPSLGGPSGEYATWPGQNNGDYAAWENTGEQPGWNLDEQQPWPAGDGTGERAPVHHEAPAEPHHPQRQSRFVIVGMLALSLIVLVGGAVVGVVYFSSSNDGVESVLELGTGGADQRAVTAPLDNRTKATFELLSGATSVRLRIGELGDDLYRISTPDDAGIKPSPVVRKDDVKLQVTKDGDGTGGQIDVVLAAKVRWALRISGYVETQVIDVSGGQISQLDMVAGMRRAEVTLSRPAGTVPLKVNGAVDELVLKSPSVSPVRIKVGGGADTVLAGTKTLKDVAAGSTLTPRGWDTDDRYDVTASARITDLTIESA